MTFSGAYILASTIGSAFIASIWSSKGWINIALKMIFVGLAVAGAIVSAATFKPV